MGYSTDFTGKFSVTPTMTAEHCDYLLKFSETRRMRRHERVCERYADPTRLAVGLPIGAEGGYFVGAHGFAGQAREESIIDYNTPPAQQPGLWCQWVPTKDGTAIEWNGAEKFYNYTEWLAYLVEHFLKPWGYTLEGAVNWQGEDSKDSGTIHVKDNDIEAIDDRLVKRKPSWASA